MMVRAILAVLALSLTSAAGRSDAASSVPEVTLATHGTSLRLAVIGDVGLGADDVMRGVRAVHEERPIDAILLVGDNVYPRGVKSVDDPAWRRLDALATLPVPILAVLGNHDYVGSAAAQVEATGRFPHWQMPARNYAVRSAAADLAMIDTTPYVTGRDGSADGSKPCAMCDALRASLSTSRKPWRIAVGHHTVVSSGWHGFLPRSEARRMRALLPLLRESRIDLYICGHDHHLELIAGTPAMLISGAASDPVPAVALHVDTVYPHETTIRERVGFAVVDITAAALRVRFYDHRGRALSGWLDVKKR